MASHALTYLYYFAALAAFVALGGRFAGSASALFVARILTAVVAVGVGVSLAAGAIFLLRFGAAFGSTLTFHDVLLLASMFAATAYFFFSAFTVFRPLESVRPIALAAHLVVMPILVILLSLTHGFEGLWQMLPYNALHGAAFAMLWFISIRRNE